MLNSLHEKLSALPSGAFPFVSEFVKLRDVVAPQIGDTRILFPEFTPHDEPLHVAKLFQLADRLFGTPVYKGMNAAELFLFACALYAHDWGMAVGQDEKAYLRSGGTTVAIRNTFTPLPDEVERLNAFIVSNGLSRGTDGTFPELGDHELRVYVRQTHAQRSGARARVHFTEHPAVGESLAQLCEGHWHDFATLDDPERFPREYEVASETAHLLALALQVRLTDLFHITDDRTPFSLWRFVSPTDRRSTEEWKKHRALHGVSVTDYPPGRAIKVQGFTEDEEVWSGLQDLRRYCRDQIKGVLDISARNVPQRYSLDFLTLDWAVTTGHLRPVDFRFEFDRGAMFRILSDDIYDGNPYVFLRELLQNSIDAIRTRRERHKRRATASPKKKQAMPHFDTTIYFTAEHKPNGDLTLCCRDYGIGMDEHIVRNYFTVAGVSYYRSAEFERQHLGFEPISRFGIGVLSCFMVSDKLKVKTFRDPECGPPMEDADSSLPGADEHRARRLSLEVPGVARQFIVRELTDNFAIGTEIELEILSQKLRKPGRDGHVPPASCSPKAHSLFQRNLKITEYLCEIAGFVEFPILVEERWPGQTKAHLTLILHPDVNLHEAKSQYEGDISVHQLSKSYPWDDVFDANAATKSLTTHAIDLKQVLGHEGYEGWVVFPKPQNEEWDFTDRESRFDYGGDKMFWRARVAGETPSPPLQIKRNSFVDSKAKNPRALFGIYRDGILLSEIDTFDELQTSGVALPLPLIRINLPSSSDSAPNVSRTSIKTKACLWEESVCSAIEKTHSGEILKALALPIRERMFRIGWLVSVFRIRFKSIPTLIPSERAVSFWLTKGNNIEVREGVMPIGTEVPLLPRELNPIVEDLVAEYFSLNPSSSKQHLKPHVVWDGQDCMFSSFNCHQSVPLKFANRLFEYYFSRYLSVTRLQVLEAPRNSDKLLVQYVSVIHNPVPHLEMATDDYVSVDANALARKDFLETPAIKNALAIAHSNPANLDPMQSHLLRQIFPASDSLDCCIGRPVGFCDPFSDCWATRHGDLNSFHPIGKAFTSCLAAVAMAESNGILGAETHERIEHLFYRYESLLQEEFDSDHRRLKQFVEEFFQMIRSLNIIKDFTAPAMPSDRDSVVSPPLPKRLRDYWRRFDSDFVRGTCGQIITKPPRGWIRKSKTSNP